MKILAIIPARGGSKGLPGKNIKLCAGKPLIGWTIEAALGSKHISETIISTDSSEIANISESFGAKVPFIRPKELSDDTANSFDVIKHAIKFLKTQSEEFDLVICLQPTSPLRKSEDIDKAIEYYQTASGKKSNCTLVSGYKLDQKYNWILKSQGDHVNFLIPQDRVNLNRQAHKEKLFMPNGAIFICSFNCMNMASFYGEETLFYEMSEKDSIDIDTKEDFDKAESCLSTENTESIS
jgi:CMP-N,N'-diacetyllegionaminic acid synthase